MRLAYGVTNSPALPGMRTQILRCRTFSVKTGTVLRKMGWLVTKLVQPVLSHEHPQYVLYTRLRWERVAVLLSSQELRSHKHTLSSHGTAGSGCAAKRKGKRERTQTKVWAGENLPSSSSGAHPSPKLNWLSQGANHQVLRTLMGK